MRSISCFFFILLLSFFASAQETKTYSFTHYTSSSGLLSDQVYSIVQDAEGYIWIGGTDGLQRFDGIRYKSFRHVAGDSLSLPFNGILQLVIDQRRRLWILMADGSAGIFDTKTFTFDKVAVKTAKQSSLLSPVRRLIVTEDGNIFYLIVGHEIVTWNEKQHRFSHSNNFFKLNNDWPIADLAQQPGTQKYWIGVQGQGIAIYNKASGQLSYRDNNIEKEPAVDAFGKEVHPNQMRFDTRGRVWFFCWTTIYPTIFCFDTRTNVAEKFELITQIRKYHDIQGFMVQKDGSIWVRGEKVFAKFLEKEKKFQQVFNGYTNESSISYEVVTSLFEDREGNIWTGTNNNGLYRFNPSREYFTNMPHTNRVSGEIGSGSPMSFMRTKTGGMFIGTWEDGLYYYDSNFNVVPAKIKGLDDKGGPFVWNMFAAADSNTIWMASQVGIYAVDQAKKTASFYNPPVLENHTVSQIAEDKNGNLWLGMFKAGAFKWKVGADKKLSPVNLSRITAIPAGNGINKILIDKQGLLWIGTNRTGAYVIDPNTNEVVLHFSKDSSGAMQLPEDGVSSILEYNDSLILLTTQSRVIGYHRQLKKSFLIGPPDVMSGAVASMEKDKNGYVWISTSSGLYRVNIKKRSLFIRFNRDDGLQYDNYVSAASYAMPDGRLLFGNSSQVVIFDPSAIRNSRSVQARLTLTDFEVHNKPLRVDSILQLKEITLSYQQNSLTLFLSTLTHNTPYLVQYKMEGLDNEWRIADKDLQLIYSYMPTGKYTLRCKIMDEEGNVSEDCLRLKIRIEPPFWKSLWFFMLLLLLAGSLLFWLDKERMKRKAALQNMRSNIAGNLHEEINTALNNINILSEMAKLKADTEPQKSKEFIEQIHSKSHQMIIAMDDMLWSISPENDSMEKTVDRMQEFIDALNNRHNAGIEMLVDKKVTLLKLDMQLRHEAFLLFKESIRVIILAGAVNCRVHVTFEKASLVYSIIFSNEHFDMPQLRNLIARQDINKRLLLIGATMDVQILTSSTVFELKVPVG